MNACVLLPVYNDWPSLPRLLVELDRAFSALDIFSTVVIINDGGRPPVNGNEFLDLNFDRITEFRMIELVGNVGNQNALGIGLSFIRDQIKCDIVVVMDSDGQDSPEHLGLLISAHRDHPDELVAAERSGRSEGLLFKTCYQIYRWVFTLLTGKRLTFGNFSVIPYQHLVRLCAMPDLTANFAATLIKSRIPIFCVPCYRADRYDGVTSQSFVNLIIHGINGVSVFSEIALVRVSLFSAAIILTTLFGIAFVAIIRFFTHLAIAGWASNVVGFLLVLMTQALLLSLIAIIVKVQRPMSMLVEPNSYKLAIASERLIKYQRAIRATS
jgi:hypothetical protein